MVLYYRQIEQMGRVRKAPEKHGDGEKRCVPIKHDQPKIVGTGLVCSSYPSVGHTEGLHPLGIQGTSSSASSGLSSSKKPAEGLAKQWGPTQSLCPFALMLSIININGVVTWYNPF